MAKAINWPAAYRDEVLSEPTEQLFCAFRLGSLYYDNCYWVDQEEVDIRVDHKIVRRAVVQGDLLQAPLSELPKEVLQQQKQALQSLDAVREFLTSTYNQPIDDTTPVTVVFYKNLPVNTDIME